MVKFFRLLKIEFRYGKGARGREAFWKCVLGF